MPSRSDLNLNGKVAKAHERNFYECFSNKSFSPYRCVEATLPFSAVAQRLKIGGYYNGKKCSCNADSAWLSFVTNTRWRISSLFSRTTPKSSYIRRIGSPGVEIQEKVSPMIFSRHAVAMRIQPGCFNAYRQKLGEAWKPLVEVLDRIGIRNFSLWKALKGKVSSTHL